jgi:hypothetical protein
VGFKTTNVVGLYSKSTVYQQAAKATEKHLTFDVCWVDKSNCQLCGWPNPLKLSTHTAHVTLTMMGLSKAKQPPSMETNDTLHW